MVLGTILFALVGAQANWAEASVSAEVAAIDSGLSVDELVADPTLVREIQRRLIDIGLYNGPVNGAVDQATADAIRRYQRQSQLPLTGQADTALLDHLDSATSQARRLLNRLSEARRAQTEAAQEALRDNSATRELLDRADATSSSEEFSCDLVDNANTAECLIVEALEVTDAVSDPDFRDWALAELAVAQAFHGDIERAVGVVTRMSDPRLVMVTLGRVAQAQASGGDIDGASATAVAIPDPRARCKAFIAIASEATARGNQAAFVDYLASAARAVGEIADPQTRIPALTQLAIVAARGDHLITAEAFLEEAISAAHDLDDGRDRIIAKGHTARASMALGDLETGLSMLSDTSEYDRFLAAARIDGVKALALVGEFDRAADIIGTLKTPLFRVIALAMSGTARYSIGDGDGARRDLNEAETYAEEIGFGFRYYRSLAEIAEAWMTIGETLAALDAADKIDDQALKARTFWRLADIHTRRGDVDQANILRTRAVDIAGRLRSGLDQAWALSDIAIAQHLNGDHEAAMTTFNMALEAARGQKAGWFRARALAKIAKTRVTLSLDPREAARLADTLRNDNDDTCPGCD